jgi:propanol-preferring alcohol dehydrogenase
MMLTRAGAGAVEACERELPVVLPGELLIKISACGVCHTDLHVVDGELPNVEIPVTPGHEIVGIVDQLGDGVEEFKIGDRVGVPWLGYACGQCAHCLAGRENLCADARFTGCHSDGGYADYVVADAAYTFKLPAAYSDLDLAPMLCAGLLGYRAYRMAGDSPRLGLYGFGAAAHIVAQIALHDGREVYAFTAPGEPGEPEHPGGPEDNEVQGFARSVGVTWAGRSDQPPPVPLDAAIVFAPAGALIPEALSRVAPGGIVVCAGMHMSDVPSFPYRLLWEERTLRSAANPTRQDARDFLALVSTVQIKVRTARYDLADANRALRDLRDGRVQGAAVLVPAG